MRVLIDTNVILDVWLAREPFWRDSAKLLGKVEEKEINGVICPTTVTTLHYLGKKVLGDQKARKLINSLLEISNIGKVSKESFKEALESEINIDNQNLLDAVPMQ